MFGRIDHVGVAVLDLDAAMSIYRDRLGMAVRHRETVEAFGVEAALLEVGDSYVELLEPLDADSGVGRFVARRGAGLHHVAYRTDDLESALEAVRAAGLRPTDGEPRAGLGGSRVAFLDPHGTCGVLTELVEPAP